MANYAFTTGKPLPEAQSGQTFEMCNFTRLAPHTKIFNGVSGLTFRNCNLINCDVPADATVIDCNRGQVEYCGNVHKKWIEKGVANCAENCTHVTGTDIIQVGGVTAATVYYHADKAVA